MICVISLIRFTMLNIVGKRLESYIKINNSIMIISKEMARIKTDWKMYCGCVAYDFTLISFPKFFN